MKARVVGPAPGSAGGIGVMSAYLKSTGSDRTVLEFVDSGGTPGTRGQRSISFLRALSTAAVTADGDGAWVLEVSSKGSTWRKLLISVVLRVRRQPYAVHLHSGGYPRFFAQQSRFAKRLIRGLFTQASVVAVLGNGWGAYVRDKLGVPADRIVLLPNAVPGPDVVPERGDEVRVLFAGRVGKRKGADTLLAAWRTLNTNGRATLVLAGDLDDPDGSITQAVEAADDVEILGWLNGEALTQEMARAKVLVLPSLAENLPLSLLEGMAWGLAPVVTPVGAVPEVVTDGENGLLVPVGDVAALASALQKVIDDDAARDRLAAAARETWKKSYSLEGYRPKFDDMVERVTRDHRAHAPWAPRRGHSSKESQQ